MELVLPSLSRILVSYLNLLSESNYILVEEQRKISPKNMRLMHHIVATLLVLCPRSDIYEVPSTYKTQLLHCPRGVDIKKWSPYRALQLFRERGDVDSYNLLASQRKQDDLADITLQIYAFLIKMGFVPSPEKPCPEEVQYLLRHYS